MPSPINTLAIAAGDGCVFVDGVVIARATTQEYAEQIAAALNVQIENERRMNLLGELAKAHACGGFVELDGDLAAELAKVVKEHGNT